MSMKNNFMRYIFYFVEIIIIYCIIQSPGMYFTSLQIKPCLLIPVAVSIAFFESQTVGLVFGVVCGLMMDVGANTFAFYSIVLSIISYVVGLLAINLIKTNVLTVTLLSLFSVIVVLTLSFVLFYVLKGYDDPAYAFVVHYLPIMLCSVIPTPVIYFLNKLLFLVFNHGKGD